MLARGSWLSESGRDGAATAAHDLGMINCSVAAADATRSNGYLPGEDVMIGSSSTQYTTDSEDSSSSDTDEGLEHPLLGTPTAACLCHRLFSNGPS